MSSTVQQSNATQKFQKSIGGSIKSLFNPGARTYFVLEHKTNTEKHRIGESANFISDYVEMGRGNDFAVNFGDDCKTVSRPHAAISRKENDWMLTPISKSNATLVNNRQINSDVQLKNGDEIQLAIGGPKLSFLIPANPSIKGMNFTIRMKAVMNEAIRPYKTTIAVITAVFIFAITGLSFVFFKKMKNSDKVIADLLSRKPQRDTLITHDTVTVRFSPHISHGGNANNTNSVVDDQPLAKLYPNIYYIRSSKVVVTDGEKEYVFNYGISGTGFLLNNGQFVTARHVVQPWMFPTNADDSTAILVNALYTKGATIKFSFTAYSPNGDKISMTNADFDVDKSKDEQKTIDAFDTKVSVTLPTANGYDWAASSNNGKSGGLAFDKQLSTSLPVSTQLFVMGYPWGRGANSETDIKPMYSECKVSRDGLDNGVIDAGNIGIDHGNSGGPVFVKDGSGSFIVIGIVSAEQGKQGFFIPISAIK